MSLPVSDRAMNGDEDSYRVELYVYDMSKGLAKVMSPALLGKQIEGIWHTGVVAYGREYFFSSGGIESCRPGGTVLGEPERIEDLGSSQVPYQLFLEYIFGLGESSYKPGAYDLLKHNCNNFSEEISEFLCGRGIPKNILTLPDEVLNTPLGEALAPLAKTLQLKDTKDRSIAFGSVNNSISAYVPREVTRHREDPELDELNSAIEEIRHNTLVLENRRNSLNEKLLKKERKEKKKERKEKKKNKNKSTSEVGEEKEIRRRRKHRGDSVHFAPDVEENPEEPRQRRFSDPVAPSLEPHLPRSRNRPPPHPPSIPKPFEDPPSEHLSIPSPKTRTPSPIPSIQITPTMDRDSSDEVPPPETSPAPVPNEFPEPESEPESQSRSQPQLQQEPEEELAPEVEREPPLVFKEEVDVSSRGRFGDIWSYTHSNTLLNKSLSSYSSSDDEEDSSSYSSSSSSLSSSSLTSSFYSSSSTSSSGSFISDTSSSTNSSHASITSSKSIDSDYNNNNNSEASFKISDTLALQINNNTDKCGDFSQDNFSGLQGTKFYPTLFPPASLKAKIENAFTFLQRDRWPNEEVDTKVSSKDAIKNDSHFNLQKMYSYKATNSDYTCKPNAFIPKNKFQLLYGEKIISSPPFSETLPRASEKGCNFSLNVFSPTFNVLNSNVINSKLELPITPLHTHSPKYSNEEANSIRRIPTEDSDSEAFCTPDSGTYDLISKLSEIASSTTEVTRLASVFSATASTLLAEKGTDTSEQNILPIECKSKYYMNDLNNTLSFNIDATKTTNNAFEPTNELNLLLVTKAAPLFSNNLDLSSFNFSETLEFKTPYPDITTPKLEICKADSETDKEFKIVAEISSSSSTDIAAFHSQSSESQFSHSPTSQIPITCYSKCFKQNNTINVLPESNACFYITSDTNNLSEKMANNNCHEPFDTKSIFNLNPKESNMDSPFCRFSPLSVSPSSKNGLIAPEFYPSKTINEHNAKITSDSIPNQPESANVPKVLYGSCSEVTVTAKSYFDSTDKILCMSNSKSLINLNMNCDENPALLTSSSVDCDSFNIPEINKSEVFSVIDSNATDYSDFTSSGIYSSFTTLNDTSTACQSFSCDSGLNVSDTLDSETFQTPLICTSTQVNETHNEFQLPSTANHVPMLTDASFSIPETTAFTGLTIRSSVPSKLSTESPFESKQNLLTNFNPIYPGQVLASFLPESEELLGITSNISMPPHFSNFEFSHLTNANSTPFAPMTLSLSEKSQMDLKNNADESQSRSPPTYEVAVSKIENKTESLPNTDSSVCSQTEEELSLSRSSTQSSIDSSMSFGSSYYTLYVVDPVMRPKTPEDTLWSPESSPPPENLSRSASATSVCSFRTITPEPEYFEVNNRSLRALRGLSNCSSNESLLTCLSRTHSHGSASTLRSETEQPSSFNHNFKSKRNPSQILPNEFVFRSSSLTPSKTLSTIDLNLQHYSLSKRCRLLSKTCSLDSMQSLLRRYPHIKSPFESISTFDLASASRSPSPRSPLNLPFERPPSTDSPILLSSLGGSQESLLIFRPLPRYTVHYVSPEPESAILCYLGPTRPYEPPIVFTNVVQETVADFDGFVNCVAQMLSGEEQQHMEELRAYVIEDEGSWSLGENFNILFARIFTDPSIPDEARRHLIRIMAAAALKDDVILMLHQDRKEHTIMNFANKIEAMQPDIQEALALFFCNMFEHLSPSEWLLYISEWAEGSQQISNIRVTTKVAVNALLHSNPKVQQYGTALMYNLGTKEVKTVVFDDVAPELAMAILQYFGNNPPEEYVWRVMTALCRFCYASSEVPTLVKMIGPDPNTFKGMSERIDQVLEEINGKLSRVRLF